MPLYYTHFANRLQFNLNGKYHYVSSRVILGKYFSPLQINASLRNKQQNELLYRYVNSDFLMKMKLFVTFMIIAKVKCAVSLLYLFIMENIRTVSKTEIIFVFFLNQKFWNLMQSIDVTIITYIQFHIFINIFSNTHVRLTYDITTYGSSH